MNQTEYKIPYRRVPREEFTPSMLELEAAALGAAKKAYAPYSNFFVGAAVRLASGEIVTGSNQENAAYPSGLCAERTALFYCGAHYPDQPVVELLVLAINSRGERAGCASPCGGCRQVLLETSERHGRPFRVILPGSDEALILEDNRDLLPFGFVAADMA